MQRKKVGIYLCQTEAINYLFQLKKNENSLAEKERKTNRRLRLMNSVARMNLLSIKL